MGVWPQSVLTRFAAIPVHPTENDIYPPYCKLLNILFAPDGPFTVAPLSYNDSFLVEFQVFWEGVPVFLLQNNTGPNLRVPSARDMADLQIRKRLGDLVETCPACPLTVPSSTPSVHLAPKFPSILSISAPVHARLSPICHPTPIPLRLDAGAMMYWRMKGLLALNLLFTRYTRLVLS